ncbi:MULTISPECIES: UDP-N-acetylmuramoyl-L-alanyl-D-glutamate--2,6-diaminopimelate ligase [Brevibacterium]|uniref:UDP-N-acetylmuramoyl-L-alanyl-D-glutamate--2,6-diaminopimelate ligase n=3 Tax=Brevibacterium TaxID=1696 RepID=A0A162Y2F7_9MICO|nr:UDP-N-acetylmuramoyl-L-alanyl-D-glutamate--2,6-diaminopimelate ligase [Brevibacterium casei]NJE68141.1 UDP-N-acetylmuramoyl-L-alanyl-D-glutamate--2,6-diaminopimelate ligase [Brevibacterium sp. LS14]SMX69951.1 UDP-N-acetylmuramoylalanyl-D-glutamate--2,6-diaminopimelate ligase [Brevibacterium casei CIP 102111]KZE11289.1 UDP-N-acetylmuramoylalanyl-D-glutamate--2,6-diaminopimelate ligase [Brevibacterium casei]MCT1447579.1 UDP-N-acetylmuramoyl-L-alanyl-D-glutamate--2,6-diaminopimelate ligase [Bre
MMRISQLLPAAPGTIHGDPDREVSGVSHDSRTVAPGQLYAALPGSNVHGARFAPDLIAAGVSAILTDPVGWRLIAEAVDPDALAAVTGLVVDDPRAVLGFVSAAVYGTDVRPELLGVTGTNGKTTTTYLLAGMLEALGRRTGVIGTVATLIDGTAVPAVRTTPEAPELHALFAKMRAADVDTCAMEVSSHALSQHRVDGAHFAVAGFTNLSQDHLDFHHSMDEYFAAKAALFTRAFADRAVIVIEDEWGERMAAAAQIPVTTLGRDDRSRLRIDHTPGESDFSLRLGEGETIPLRSPLPGDFNVTNTALAAAMLVESGIPATELSAIGRTFTAAVPGRMEVIGIAEDAAHELPRAIVDYSHTPDAIAKALASLDADSDELVIVVGAGGDRDPGKRHGMGAAAARGADVIVLTDDNPRSEDPAAIRAAVRAGIDAEIAAGGARVKKVIEIGDRGEAIDKAIASASPATTVLIAGKGHETGQSAGGVVTEFDDRSRTRSALTARLGRPETGKVHS